MINFNVGLEHYLVLSAIIFVIGVCGLFLNRRNVIVVLMSMELMLLAVNINFITFSSFFQELSGQIFSLFVLTVAAADAAIGLAIIVIFYRNRGSIEMSDISNLRG